MAAPRRDKDSRRQFKDVGSLQRMGEALGWEKRTVGSYRKGESPTPSTLSSVYAGKGHVKKLDEEVDPTPYYQASVTRGYGA